MSGSDLRLLRPAALAIATLALAATAGLAFAGWVEHTPGIVMALAESGLAWCF